VFDPVGNHGGPVDGTRAGTGVALHGGMRDAGVSALT
jgi:hypothetical protein